MVRPDETVFLVVHPYQVQPYQAGAVGLEAFLPVRRDIFLEPVLPLIGRHASPVFLVPADLDVREHDLDRLLHVVPDERGSHHRVPADYLVPRVLERVPVQPAVVAPDELLDVLIGARGVAAVEQQPDLQGR